MKLSADCIACLVTRQWEQISKFDDEPAKAAYMRDVLRTVADAGIDDSAPVVVAAITRLHRNCFGDSDDFDIIKAEYNARLLQLEQDLSGRIARSGDPLASAVKLARAGNYIDFGAMGRIEDSKLLALIGRAESEELDAETYRAFAHDLETARSLVYLTDNCGEIVLDKLLIRTIQQRYPRIQITAVVRGAPVLNDATQADASAVGMPDVCEVLGNGTDIGGTQLDRINAESKERITGADIVLSKGQGNFETLHGCGLNVYYLFLCKCAWFTRRFGLELHKGVFVSEGNVRIAHID